jgi:hypothetical protein
MATFLQLCQKLTQDSGTADSSLPSTVVGQTGRLLKHVNWVNEAWRMIQSAEQDWRWMQGRFSGTALSGQRDYSGSDLGVATRFGNYICRNNGTEDRYTSYKTSDGVAEERVLLFVEYDQFVPRYMRGTQTNDAPTYFTIAPDGKLWLHPIPDASYTIQGPYRKSPQTLSLDGDTPEMPEEFHDLIVDVALQMSLAIHDESPQVGGWAMRRTERYNQLRRSQLPTMQLAPGYTFA